MLKGKVYARYVFKNCTIKGKRGSALDITYKKSLSRDGRLGK